jgi:hypothetical protein
MNQSSIRIGVIVQEFLKLFKLYVARLVFIDPLVNSLDNAWFSLKLEAFDHL